MHCADVCARSCREPSVRSRLCPGVASVTLGGVSCGATASERLTYRLGGSFSGFWVSGSAGRKSTGRRSSGVGQS